MHLFKPLALRPYAYEEPVIEFGSMAKISSNIRELALVGARARIQELHAEIEQIRQMFPGEFGLRGGGKKPRKPRRRKMSAEARRRISEAQKARWAKQKAKTR